jgi:hypothetical protein
MRSRGGGNNQPRKEGNMKNKTELPLFYKVKKQYMLRLTEQHKDMIRELYSLIRQEFDPKLDEQGRFRRYPIHFILGYLFAKTDKIAPAEKISKMLQSYESALLVPRAVQEPASEVDALKQQMTSMQDEMARMRDELMKRKLAEQQELPDVSSRDRYRDITRKYVRDNETD